MYCLVRLMAMTFDLVDFMAGLDEGVGLGLWYEDELELEVVESDVLGRVLKLNLNGADLFDSVLAATLGGGGKNIGGCAIIFSDILTSKIGCMIRFDVILLRNEDSDNYLLSDLRCVKW